MRFHCLNISGGSGDNTASGSAAAAAECIYRVIVSVGEVLCLEDSSWYDSVVVVRCDDFDFVACVHGGRGDMYVGRHGLAFLCSWCCDVS